MLHRRLVSSFCALLLLAGCRTMKTGSATGSGERQLSDSVASRALMRPEKGAQKRTTRTLERARNDHGMAQVVFQGDSITQFWEIEGKATFAREFAQWKTLNIAVSGDQTQHVLWRQENGGLDTLNPKVYCLLIGTNNVGNGKGTPAEIADAIEKIVRELHAHSPAAHIIITKIFPRNDTQRLGKYPHFREDIQQVNALIEKQITGDYIEWVDINEQIAPGGNVTDEYFKDKLHLTAKGYDVWAAALKPHIEKDLQ